MADDKMAKQPVTPPAPVTPANVAPSPSAEGVPGGRYIVDGVAVDAEGKPLDEQTETPVDTGAAPAAPAAPKEG